MVETMWFNLPNVLEDRVVSLEKEVELDISAGNIFSFEEKLRLQVEEEKEKEKREKQRYEILMSLFVCLIQIMAMCVFITLESYFFERHEIKKSWPLDLDIDTTKNNTNYIYFLKEK
jgi:hypothetical protein